MGEIAFLGLDANKGILLLRSKYEEEILSRSRRGLLWELRE